MEKWSVWEMKPEAAELLNKDKWNFWIKISEIYLYFADLYFTYRSRCDQYLLRALTLAKGVGWLLAGKHSLVENLKPSRLKSITQSLKEDGMFYQLE